MLPSYDDVVSEDLPPYAAAVEKYVSVQFKLEYSTPFTQCKDNMWYDTVMHLNSTQLNFYTSGQGLPEPPVALSKNVPGSIETTPVASSSRRLSEKLSRFTKTYLPAFDPVDLKSTVGISSQQQQQHQQQQQQVTSNSNSTKKKWLRASRSDGPCFDNLYDVHSEYEITETQDFMDVTKENGYRLDRSYSLQGAKFGLSTAEFKKKFYIETDEIYKDGFLLNLRVRAENQQFLIRFNRINDMILWSMYLNMGINIAKDLQDREYPTYRVVPRRNRRLHNHRNNSNSNNRRRRRTSSRASRSRSSSNKYTPDYNELQVLERKRSNSLLSQILGTKAPPEPAQQIDFKNPFKTDATKDSDICSENYTKKKSKDLLTPPLPASFSVTPSSSTSSASSNTIFDTPDLSRSPSECFSLFQTLTANSSFCEYDTNGKANPFSLDYNFDIWSPAEFVNTLQSGVKSRSPKLERASVSADSNIPVIGEVDEGNEAVDMDEDQETDIDMEDYGLEEVDSNGEELYDDNEDNDFDENNKWNPVKKEQSRRRYIKHSLRCVKPLLKEDTWVGEQVYIKVCAEDARNLYPKAGKELGPYCMAIRTVGPSSYE